MTMMTEGVGLDSRGVVLLDRNGRNGLKEELVGGRRRGFDEVKCGTRSRSTPQNS